MTAPHAWTPAEGSLTDILKKYPRTLNALVAGEIPAIVLRKAFNPDHCAGLVKRLYERGLAYDPRRAGDGRERVYVGPGLVGHSAEPEKFFACAADTHELFKTLFNISRFLSKHDFYRLPNFQRYFFNISEFTLLNSIKNYY